MGFLTRLLGRKDDGPTAARQQGDPTVLNREDDPRGGTQSDEYRHADPRDLVDEAEVPMMGPAGAPQDGTTVEERREASRAQREQAMARHPPEEED